MKQAKNKTKIIALCSAAVLVAAGFMGAQSLNKKNVVVEEVDPRIIVETASPTKGNLVVTGEYIGTVEPNQQVVIYPKSSGEVLTTNFMVGDVVQEGDVLCELDARALRSSIAQTQATIASAQSKANYNLEVAQQNLDTYQYNIENGTNSALLSARASVEAAEVRLETANASLRAARRTYTDARDGDSYTEYNDDQIDSFRDAKVQAEITQESAQLSLQQAKEALVAAEAAVRDQEVTVNNSIKLAELNTDFSDQYIALQKLQNDLADSVIKAPISGIIEQRNVDPYDVASPQSPVYVISNKDMMTVSFKIPEASLEYVRAGDKVTLDKKGETCTGSITEIATMADAGSGLFTVKASVEYVPFELHSGSSIKIFADTKKAENAILIPIDCLYYDSGKPYVYIMEDGAAKRVYVETGISNEENIQILSGITTTDNIITTWDSSLIDGAPIVTLQQLEEEVQQELLEQELAAAASQAAEESSGSQSQAESANEGITSETDAGTLSNESAAAESASEINSEESDPASEAEDTKN